MCMKPIYVAHRFRFTLGIAILLLSLIPVAFLAISYASIQDDVHVVSYRVEEELRLNDSFFMTFNVSNTGTVSHSPVILVQVVSDSQTYHWDVPYFPDLKPGETRSEMWRIHIPSSVLLSPYEISLGVQLEPFPVQEKTVLVAFIVISFPLGLALALTSLRRTN